MRRALRATMVAATAAGLACGIPSPSVSSTTGAETGDVTDDAAPTEVPDLGPDDGNLDCMARTAALAPIVTQPDGGCSVVVRLDHDTLQPVGYRSLCAPYSSAWLDEQQARELTQCCATAGTSLSPPGEQHLWVFELLPGVLGHVAVVSNHVAQRLFEATTGWGEDQGEILFPEAWDDPSALGSECGLLPMPEDIRSYEPFVEGPLPEGELEEVWAVVGSTALPFAMSTVGRVQRVLVLLYPGTMGPFDPLTAEYVVVLEGGIERPPPPP